MRDYLSSYRMGRRGPALRTRGGKALVVMNALDEFDERLLSWDREARDLADLGYSCEELDLRDYWGADAAALCTTLSRADLIWVVGGNAFVLTRAATEARLADALAGNQQLTYAGHSAGACLASIALRGIELMDDPHASARGYWPDMPMTMLRLIGNRLIPHAGTPSARIAAASLAAQGLTFTELRDGEDCLFEITQHRWPIG